ncbi:MAG: hypothetical protein NZ870_04035 [bacterium]|nr:hypothetical protein [bacterium]MCX8189566.1 hypothetical protein [Nitrososphaeria archaeon]
MEYDETLSERQIKIKSAQIINYSLSFLGENAKNAILYHFMKSKNLTTLEEIIDHIDEFEDFLIGIFGYGATFILPLIVNRLYNQFRIEPQSFAHTSLSKALKEIRRKTVQ